MIFCHTAGVDWKGLGSTLIKEAIKSSFSDVGEKKHKKNADQKKWFIFVNHKWVVVVLYCNFNVIKFIRTAHMHHMKVKRDD